MSASSSNPSEEELLAEEFEDEGQKDKESPTGERNAVVPRRSQQLKDQAAASSEEINLLTNAVLGLKCPWPKICYFFIWN